MGKTTGWVHRVVLKDKKVKMLNGVQYHRVSDRGLEIEHRGETKTLEVDHVVVCAGQESLTELEPKLKNAGFKVSLIGGALEARELDAKRAIDQACRLAAKI